MKPNAQGKLLAPLLPLLAVGVGLALLVLDPLPIQALRHQLFDQYQRWHPRPYEAVPVRIVDIDDDSLARLGQWPWPRARLAELVEHLGRAGAAAIVFDFVFAEADRTSPRQASAAWPLSADLRARLAALPDHDQVFAASLARHPVVIGFTLERGPLPAAVGEPPLNGTFRYVEAGESPAARLPLFDRSLRPLPVLAAAAPGLGAFSFVPDGDGVVRRVPLAMRLAAQTVPSLAAEALRVGLGQRNYVLKAAGGEAGLAEVRIGALTIPTTAEGELWVHYSRPVAGRYLPAWKVLAGEAGAGEIDGHLVLVGSSAPGLMDLRFSPLGTIVPGVEVHAQALEQILSGHFLQRPAWATAAEALSLVVGGLALGFAALRRRALPAAALAAAALAGVFGASWQAFAAHGLLLDPVAPALTLGVSFLLSSLCHHFLGEREQRWIRAAFARYVSPNRVAHLVDHPEAMQLGGRRQECSFVFTDLAGFTGLMEGIDAGEAVALLNGYLDGMIAIAFRHEGTLDRIVGDALAIVFSAPVVQADYRERALACALAMDAFASRYAGELRAKGYAFGETRIGVHAGEVIVGNFGGATMFDYRALGDAVNTASRLEGVNKHLGTRICVSEAVAAASPPVPMRPVARLVLKGKERALAVFEPLTADNSGTCAPLPAYLEAYAALRDGEPQALSRFAALAVAFPADPLVAFHHRRLLAGESGERVVMGEK